MKRISLIIIFHFLCFNFFGQITFLICLDDSINSYFKLNERFTNIYDIDYLKDSLPDGIYIFYDVKRKNIKKGNIMIKGEYKNGVKEGLFEKNFFVGSGKKSIIKSQHLCTFKNGLKHGIDQEYNFGKGSKYQHTKNEFHLANNIQLNTYAEFQFGKLNGLFMYFNNGHPIRIYIYENDILKTKLLEIYAD
jgi:hypothetical protein